MLAKPELEICLTQDLELSTGLPGEREEQDTASCGASSSLLPRGHTQYTLTQLTYLACFQRTTQFGYIFFFCKYVI